MAQPLLSQSIPRIVPPRSHTRNASRSPTRRQFADDLLSDLSPATTLEAFTCPSGKLKASVEAATPSERAFGLRATLASKKIQEWVDELTQWPWPAEGGSVGFEIPAAKRRKLSNSDSGYGSQKELAEPEYLGSLLEAEVTRYEDRLDEIEGDMEDLHVEEIKRQVLDTHFSARSRPSSSASNAPAIPGLLATYVKMDDFTAIVTATVLQSLPNLSRLLRLMDVWSVRLSVLRKVPPLLQALEDTEAALRSSWGTIENPGGVLTRDGETEAALSRENFNVMRDLLQDKVTTLGQDLDYMLDTLEGRQDTLPESWLDRMEVIEQNYGEWVVSGDTKVREGEWMRMAKARKEEEDAQRAQEAAEAEIAIQQLEELESARPMAQAAQDREDQRRRAEEAEAAKTKLAEEVALQEASDALRASFLAESSNIKPELDLESYRKGQEEEAFAEEAVSEPKVVPEASSLIRERREATSTQHDLDDLYCEGCEAETLRKSASTKFTAGELKVPTESTSTSSASSLVVGPAANLEARLRNESGSIAQGDLEETTEPRVSRYATLDGACSEFSEPAIKDFVDSSFPEEDLQNSLPVEKSNLEPLLSPLITTLEGDFLPQSPSSASSTSRTFKSPITDSDGLSSPPFQGIQNFGPDGPTALAHGSSSPLIPEEQRPASSDSSCQSLLGAENPDVEFAEAAGLTTLESEAPLESAVNDRLGLDEHAELPKIEAQVAAVPGPQVDHIPSHASEVLTPKRDLEILSSSTYTRSETEEVPTTETSQTKITNAPASVKVDNSTVPKDPLARSSSEDFSEASPFLGTPHIQFKHVPVLLASPEIADNRFPSNTMSPVVEEDILESSIESGDGSSESVMRPHLMEPIEIQDYHLPTLASESSMSSVTSNTHNPVSHRQSVSSDTPTIIAGQPGESASPPYASPLLEDSSNFPEVEEQSPTAGRIGLRRKSYGLSPPRSPSSVSPTQRQPSQSDLREDSPIDLDEPPPAPIKFSLNEDAEESSPPRPPSPKKATTDEQIQQQISTLLESIPARFRLTSEPNSSPFVAETLRPLKTRRSTSTLRSSSSMSNCSTSSRAATPSFTLAPAFSKTTQRSRAPSANPEIKVYHLSRSTGEAPIKLFVRLVGEQGERVMVRVGGGWADLGEYLKEYASHHGRRTAADGADKVEIQDLPQRVVSTSSNASTTTLRGNDRSSPSPRPVSVMERERPGSSLLIRKTRKSMGESSASRFSDIRSPSTPLPVINRRPFDTPPSATSVSSSTSGNAPSGRSSRMSWTEEDSSLGLAGPKSKKVSISERDQEWVESMKEKVRLASAEKERREREREKDGKTSFGELDKVGGTKRLFRKGPGQNSSRRESEA